MHILLETIVIVNNSKLHIQLSMLYKILITIQVTLS